MDKQSLQILIVEDNPAHAQLVITWLSASGKHHIHHVTSLTDALVALEAEPSDVALLDLNLPDSDGLNTFRLLQQAKPFLPIVITTGVHDANLGLQAVQEGAEDYVVKGQLDLSALQRKLSYAVARKATEQALRDSERRYHGLFENSPISLWELDFSGAKTFLDELRAVGVGDLGQYLEDRPQTIADCLAQISILDVNSATLALYETASKDELLGSLRRILPDNGEGNKKYVPSLLAIAEGFPRCSFEMSHRTLQGHQIDIAVTWAVAPGCEDTYSSVMVSVIDLTAMKRAEAHLRASEQRYHTVVEDQTEVICRFDTDGRLMFANSAYGRFLGQPAEDLLGQTVASFILPWDLQESGNDCLTFSQAKPLVTYERHVRSAAHDLRWLHWTCRAFFDGNGQISEYQAVGHDITERKIADIQILELTLERQKVTQLSNFVRDVSHDLYTPLSILSTGLYLLPKTLGQDAKIDRMRNMQHQIERMKALIGEGIVLASLDSGPALVLDKLDLKVLMSSIASSMLHSAESGGLDFVLDLEDAPPLIEGDEALLRQAIVQVVDNALQFTPDGGSITLRLQNSSEAVIEVIDTGMGIASEDLDHIFDRFYRADKARSEETGGAGLGLAITKRIVELHGGHVDVASDPGKGSTFRIVLPIYQQTGST